MNIKALDKEYKNLQNTMRDLSNKITDHLKSKFDNKINGYNSFDDFLEDINNYAGDTFGKLMYINHAKNIFEGKEKIKEKAKQEQG